MQRGATIARAAFRLLLLVVVLMHVEWMSQLETAG